MQSPPARAEATRVISLSHGVGPSGGVTQVDEPVNQFTQTQAEGQGGGLQQLGFSHQTGIVKQGLFILGKGRD